MNEVTPAAPLADDRTRPATPMLADPNITETPKGWKASCCGMLASVPAHAAWCGNYRP